MSPMHPEMGGSVTGVAAQPVAPDVSKPQQLPWPHGKSPLPVQYVQLPLSPHAHCHGAVPTGFLQLIC
jgi:hypothetical protein